MINMLAKEFPKSEGFQVTDETLGVYRYEEHMDNPINIKDIPNEKPFQRKGLFSHLRGVDPLTLQKTYLEASYEYMRKMIHESVRKYQESLRPKLSPKTKDRIQMDAFRLFGNALHPFKDFFSHSN